MYPAFQEIRDPLAQSDLTVHPVHQALMDLLDELDNPEVLAFPENEDQSELVVMMVPTEQWDQTETLECKD